MDARIALRTATAALPVAPAELQNALAVSVLTADRVLAELEGRPTAPSSPPARRRWSPHRGRPAGRTPSFAGPG
jgi:hypothetical protein